MHYLLIAAIAFCLASGVLSALDAAAGNPMRGRDNLGRFVDGCEWDGVPRD